MKDKKDKNILIEKINNQEYVICCSICGEIAFSIKIVVEENGKNYVQFRGFMGAHTKFEKASIIKGVAETTFSLLDKGNLRDLAYYYSQLRFMREGLYAYCKECGKIYCGKHWETKMVFESDGWYDCTYGICPKGHRKMVDD